MPRSFNEPWEPEDVFDRMAAQEHREKIEAAKLRNQQLLEVETRLAAELKAKADDLTRRANETMMIGEYQARGVKPPFVDFDGRPTVSLAMLLWQGWTIEGAGGENVLVKPKGRSAAAQSRQIRDGNS